MFRTLSLLSALSAGLALPALAPAAGGALLPNTSVPALDLQRYAGKWYEQASLPMFFTRACVSDTTAQYTPQADGTMAVRNRCRTADGTVEDITGIAKVVPGSGNARLRVSFFRPFYGDYWILAFGPGERWVLVGEPKRQFGWVLSRTPQLPPSELDAALARAEALGYDRRAFKTTPQTQPLD